MRRELNRRVRLLDWVWKRLLWVRRVIRYALNLHDVAQRADTTSRACLRRGRRGDRLHDEVARLHRRLGIGRHRILGVAQVELVGGRRGGGEPAHLEHRVHELLAGRFGRAVVVPEAEPALGIVLVPRDVRVVLGRQPAVWHEVVDVAPRARQFLGQLGELLAAHVVADLGGGVAHLVDRNRLAPPGQQVECLAPGGQPPEGPVDRLLVRVQTPQVDLRAHLGPVGEHALDEFDLVARDRRVHQIESAGHHGGLGVYGLDRRAGGEVEVGEALRSVGLRIPVEGDVGRVPDLPHVHRDRLKLRVSTPEVPAGPVTAHERRRVGHEVRHVALVHLRARVGGVLLRPRRRVVERRHPPDPVLGEVADDRVEEAPVVAVRAAARRGGLRRRPAGVGAHRGEPALRHRLELGRPRALVGVEQVLGVDAVVAAADRGGAGGHRQGAERDRGCHCGERAPPLHDLISSSTASRFSSMSSRETSDSRLRRSSGSVFEGRTLKCQSL
jgi:hypothetical protein